MSGTQLRFIVQKHKTPHPHYDLRLEMGGILKSWILPRDFPTEWNEKRLAIEDKDQEFELISSRGVVSDGYGMGEAEVWDNGIYEIRERRRSKIAFRAQGEKFPGRFVLLLPSWGIWGKKRLWVLFRD